MQATAIKAVHTEADSRAAALVARYAGLDGMSVLEPMVHREFPRRIGLVSSFGTESAVLLALVAEVDPSVPVIFLDTGKLFGETRRYRDQLVTRLGLAEVRIISPLPRDLATVDPNGTLWQSNHDRCCAVRKVLPLARALSGFDAWISGRKRFQGAGRSTVPTIEVEGEHIKINPLATWSKERLDEEFARRDLPRHPLEADGFLSIGCMPCTARVAPGADSRSGRWAGSTKTECGIHQPLDQALASLGEGI
ncbi:MAG: phosphoadenylyl-sulfate reductase [Azospirillum sp.]|nr:phosphoadenylyl-sulfate reductase [Azospirillum sp.]